MTIGGNSEKEKLNLLGKTKNVNTKNYKTTIFTKNNLY